MTRPTAAEAEIRKKLCAFEDFINEPPRMYDVEPMEVRDYRHQAYRLWSPLCAALLSILDARELALDINDPAVRVAYDIETEDMPEDWNWEGSAKTLAVLVMRVLGRQHLSASEPANQEKVVKANAIHRSYLGVITDWSAPYEVVKRLKSRRKLAEMHARAMLDYFVEIGWAEYGRANNTYRITDAGRAALATSPAQAGKE